MKRTHALVVLVLWVAVGCSDSTEPVSNDHHHESHPQLLAHDGPWVPPDDIVNQAANFDIEFTGAGPWVGESGCSGNFTAGGAALRQWVYDNWPQVSHVGGYACRPINGDSSTMSVHATGRAIDIHIPLDGGQADNDLGDPLANWLLEHAEEIGVQSIIWDRWIWSPSRSSRSRAYTGAHPHHDHLHVELTPEASRLETPWFQGEMGAPTLSGCDEPLPAQGGVIDDSNTCFQAFGPAQYWRVVEGEGEGGSLRWTNAFKSDEPSNWARWRINLEEAGEYALEYRNVPTYAIYDSARYVIRHNGEESDVYVDLSAGTEEWESLGRFTFAAGSDQWVAIHDNAPIEVPDDQHILADAIRLRRVMEGLPPAIVDSNNETPDVDPMGDETTDNDVDGVTVSEGCSTSSIPRPTPLMPLLVTFFAGVLRRKD